MNSMANDGGSRRKRSGGRGRGGGRGFGRNDGRGRGRADGYGPGGLGYEDTEMDLLRKCGYNFQAFNAARDAAAAAQGAPSTAIPPDGFNSQNPPNEDTKAVESKVEGGDEGGSKTGDTGTKEPNDTQGKPSEEEAPIDGRAVKNYYGQFWKKTVEPPVAVRIAFVAIHSKLESEKQIIEEDFKMPSNETADQVGGISLAISIATLIAFHRADVIDEKIDTDKVFRYLSWFKMEKLLQIINDVIQLDRVIKTIMSFKGGIYSFDPKKINLSKLKALHGAEQYKLLEDEKSAPKEATLTASIKNALERMYPGDAEEMMKQVAKMPMWEKANLVYMDGSLQQWVSRNCPSGTNPKPPARYDLSRFSGFSEHCLENITDGRYEMNGSEITEEQGTPAPEPSSNEDTDLKTEIGLEIEKFLALSTKEKRELLMKELPSYILKTAPENLSALTKLKDMSDDEVVSLTQRSKLQEFLAAGGDKMAPSYSKSNFKYGKDDHGSNEIKTYLIQLRSSTKLNTITGTTVEAFSPFIRFTHGLLTSIGHTCEFVQWTSSSGAPPINRSDNLPVGTELEKYIGQPVVHSKQANKFRSFFFKMRTSYPVMHRLTEQQIEVNGRYEQPFYLFLKSVSLILEVFQSNTGPRQRFLLRETTRNWDPEETKAELLARAAAKGLNIDPNLYQVSWGTCKTEQGRNLATGGLCVYCSIEDDEVVEEATAKLPFATLVDYPVTSKVSMVDAIFTKNTKANAFQYYEQLKYHDDHVNGMVYLTVAGLPNDMHPFIYVPTDTSHIQLGDEFAHKVVKATLPIGKLLMLHKFDLDGNVASSPIRAIHRNKETGNWYLEAPSNKAGILGLLKGDIAYLINTLTGCQIKITQEGMISNADTKLEAVRRRQVLKEKNSKASDEKTAESTVPESVVDQATETPPKPPQPVEEPTEIPPTPAESVTIPSDMFKELTDSLGILNKLAEAVSNQTSQMEQLRKEIGEIKTTITNQKPVEEVMVSNLTNKVSELTDTTEALKKDVVTVEYTTEQIKQVIGAPTSNIEDQADIYHCVRQIVSAVTGLQSDFEESQKQQEFLVKLSLAVEKDIKSLQDREERQGEPNTEMAESLESEKSKITTEVKQVIKPLVDRLIQTLQRVPKDITKAFDEQLNTAIMRCLMGQGSLRLLLHEKMDPADREEKEKIFQGHTHTQLSAINSLSFEEVTRLLHKSPNVAARLDIETNSCGKCQEVAVQGQMSTCTFCDTAFHKLCHDPPFFLRREDRDYNMCRLCRDDLHLERLIENIQRCSSCMKYLKSTRVHLEERAARFDFNERIEREYQIRDAVAGNDVWRNLIEDVENNLLFAMQRICPEEDPEGLASTSYIQEITEPSQANASTPKPYVLPGVPPSLFKDHKVEELGDTRVVSMKFSSGEIIEIDLNSGMTELQRLWILHHVTSEQRKGIDPPTGATPKREESEEAQPERESGTPDETSTVSDPSTPQTKQPNTANEENESQDSQSSESDESTSESEEDTSVAKKEEAKARRTLKPPLKRTYNLRRSKSAPLSPSAGSGRTRSGDEGEDEDGGGEGSDSESGNSIL